MPIFHAKILVNKAHVEGGRLTHIALIQMLQKARLDFLAKHDMSEDHITAGVGFVIGELNVRYVGAARENDTLEISIGVGEVAEKKCALVYQIKTDQGKIIAFARTDIVFVDMKQEKATKIPAKFLEIIDSRSMKHQLPELIIKSRL